MKTLLTRVAVIMMCLAGVVAMAEGALRHFRGLYGSKEAQVFVHDPLLGWRFRPLANDWHQLLDFRVEYHINSKGLRDREFAYDKQAGTFRILMLGDSVVEGYGVAQQDTFSKQLETSLLNEGQGVEVINAGVRGYDTAQQILFFEREGAKYQPDLTLMTFGLNAVNSQDRFGMGARIYFKPHFVLEGGQLLLKGVPVPVWQDPPRWIRPVAQRLSPLVTYQLFRYHVTARQNRAPAVTPSRPKVDDHDSWAAAWAIEQALLERFKDSVARAGGRLAIVMDDSKTRSPADLSKWSALENYCVSKEIPYVRLYATPQFHNVTESVNLVYDPHWNNRGHHLAAVAIREFLERVQLLPVDRPRRTATRTGA
jgi:hypothetical protein